MGSRFIEPGVVVRLPLSGGDWIDVRARLNTKQHREMLNRLVKDVDVPIGGDRDGPSEAPTSLPINPLEAGLTQVLAYVVDWSLTDDRGEPAMIRTPFGEVDEARLRNYFDHLDPDSSAEIISAVQAHDATVAALRVQEKKRRGDASKSGATSPSLAAVAGGTNG